MFHISMVSYQASYYAMLNMIIVFYQNGCKIHYTGAGVIKCHAQMKEIPEQDLKITI